MYGSVRYTSTGNRSTGTVEANRTAQVSTKSVKPAGDFSVWYMKATTALLLVPVRTYYLGHDLGTLARVHCSTLVDL